MWHASLFREGEGTLHAAEHISDEHNIEFHTPLRGNTHQHHLGIFASFNGVSERDEDMERRHQAIEARIAAHKQIPKNRITREDGADEIAVFDQMVCLWTGRYTGKLEQRGMMSEVELKKEEEVFGNGDAA